MEVFCKLSQSYCSFPYLCTHKLYVLWQMVRVLRLSLWNNNNKKNQIQQYSPEFLWSRDIEVYSPSAPIGLLSLQPE